MDDASMAPLAWVGVSGAATASESAMTREEKGRKGGEGGKGVRRWLCRKEAGRAAARGEERMRQQRRLDRSACARVWSLSSSLPPVPFLLPISFPSLCARSRWRLRLSVWSLCECVGVCPTSVCPATPVAVVHVVRPTAAVTLLPSLNHMSIRFDFELSQSQCSTVHGIVPLGVWRFWQRCHVNYSISLAETEAWNQDTQKGANTHRVIIGNASI